MIDMSLLPAEFRDWIAIPACSEGSDMRSRFTLRVGDIIRPVKAPAVSMSAHPSADHEALLIAVRRWQEDRDREYARSNTLMVGRDVSARDLYVHHLWPEDDWGWIDFEKEYA